MRARALGSALVPAVARGCEGPGAYGRAVPDYAAPGEACMLGGGVVAVQKDPRRGGLFYELLRDRPQVEYVRGRRCPYPARPSDSVFSGGSGYVIKNETRVAIGCAF